MDNFYESIQQIWSRHKNRNAFSLCLLNELKRLYEDYPEREGFIDAPGGRRIHWIEHAIATFERRRWSPDIFFHDAPQEMIDEGLPRVMEIAQGSQHKKFSGFVLEWMARGLEPETPDPDLVALFAKLPDTEFVPRALATLFRKDPQRGVRLAMACGWTPERLCTVPDAKYFADTSESDVSNGQVSLFIGLYRQTDPNLIGGELHSATAMVHAMLPFVRDDQIHGQHDGASYRLRSMMRNVSQHVQESGSVGKKRLKDYDDELNAFASAREARQAMQDILGNGSHRNMPS